jgi:anti-sigma factor (TIGR02949 family)
MSTGEMIPCDHVIAELWEYIDGELSEDNAARIEAHLDIYGRCFPEYDFRRAYRTFARRVGPRPMPSAAKRRVFDAILQEERRAATARAGAASERSGGVAGLLRRFFRRG